MCAPLPRLRLTPPPPRATAAATAAIAAQLLSARVCCAAHSCPPPMGLTGRGLLLPARSYWQLGWRVTSGKFRSGLLPQFQHQLRALLFCVLLSPALHTHVRVSYITSERIDININM